MTMLIVIFALVLIAIPVSFVMGIVNHQRTNQLQHRVTELTELLENLGHGQHGGDGVDASSGPIDDAPFWTFLGSGLEPVPVTDAAAGEAMEEGAVVPPSQQDVDPWELGKPPELPPTRTTSPKHPVSVASRASKTPPEEPRPPRPISHTGREDTNTPATPAGVIPALAFGAAGPRSHPHPRSMVDLERIFGGQWLSWIGVLALLVGSGFFLGVDLGSSVLSGLPQVLIGVGAAVGFNAMGRYWSERRERILGLCLLGGGRGLLYLAAYASYGFHQLVPLAFVFPLLLVVATVGAFMALDRNSLVIASLTLAGALVTPFILASGDAPRALLPYLVAVNLGAVLVGQRRGGWTGLPASSFAVSVLLVATWFDAQYVPELRGFAFFFLAGSWLVFAVAPWLWERTTELWSYLRAMVLTLNGLMFALACYVLLEGGLESWQGPMLLVLATAYVILSRIMRTRHGEDAATRLTFCVGVALAALFAPVQFDQASVTLVWLALAAVLVYSGLRERDLWQRVSGLAVLTLALFRSVLFEIPQTVPMGREILPIWNAEFVAGVALVAVLVWLARIYPRYETTLRPEEALLWRPLQVLAAGVGIERASAELLWFFQWRGDRLGIEFALTAANWLAILWVIYGAAVLLRGEKSGFRALRLTGEIVLAGGAVLSGFMAVGPVPGGYWPLFNLTLFQGGIAVVFLGGLFWWFHRDDLEGVLPASYYGSPLLIATASLLLVTLSAEVFRFVPWLETRFGRDFGVLEPFALASFWGVYAAAAIVWGTRRKDEPLRIFGDLVLALATLSTITLVLSPSHVEYRPILNATFLEGVGIVAILGGLFWWFHREGRDSKVPTEYYGAPLLLAALVLLFLEVSVEVQSFFKLRNATTAGGELQSMLGLSVTWALYSGAVIVSGFVRRYRPVRLLGISLLALTVLKVFVVDLQALDRGYRIVAFLVLGVLSLAISVLYQRERAATPREAE